MAYCLLYIVQILIGNVGFLGRTDPEVLSDAKSFFRKEILQFIDPNQGTSVFGELNVPLLISVFFSVGLCFIIVAKGIQTSSKVAFFTVISPYFLFVIMLIRLFFLEGSGSGVAALFRVDFSALFSPAMWRNAFDQNFFQNSLGWGLLLVFATFRTRNQSVLDSAVLFFHQNPDCEFPDWLAREYRRFWLSWSFLKHQWNPTDRTACRRKWTGLRDLPYDSCRFTFSFSLEPSLFPKHGSYRYRLRIHTDRKHVLDFDRHEGKPQKLFDFGRKHSIFVLSGCLCFWTVLFNSSWILLHRSGQFPLPVHSLFDRSFVSFLSLQLSNQVSSPTTNKSSKASWLPPAKKLRRTSSSPTEKSSLSSSGFSYLDSSSTCPKPRKNIRILSYSPRWWST